MIKSLGTCNDGDEKIFDIEKKMSVALLPQIGGTMDDSAMQEDHPGDAAIAIDMESPKHQEQTPHEMAFTTTADAQPYWTTNSDQNTDAQLVDVEFDTEDHGMMSAAEVEMSAAAHGEEYEYEMTYEGGGPESNYETIDTEVPDAELHDVTVPHVESHFGTSSLEPAVEPVGMLTVPPVDLSATVVSPSQPPPSESEILAPAPTIHEPPPSEDLAAAVPTTAVIVEPPPYSLDNEQPISLARAENVEPGVEEPALITGYSPETTGPPGTKPEGGEDVAPVAETPTEESTLEAPPLEQQAEEVVEPAQERLEDAQQSEHIPVTTVLLTAFSEASTVAQTLALFKEPDVSLVPSTSQSISDTRLTLLDQHHHLFAEPIATMLMELRKELQNAEPAIFSRSEFEYREFQLVVRDLQLVLTEDNIYAHKITLSDLVSMHQSCGLSGYLHLDISLQSRFIDRYNVIKQAIENHANSGSVDPAVSAPEGVHAADNAPEADENYGDGEPEPPLPEDADEEPEPPLPEDADGELEPPLPEDADGDAWSEEQDEYQADAIDELAQPVGEGETNDWEDVGEGVEPTTENQDDTQEDNTAQEEYVHEDEYVPGDELPFAGFDETELANEYDAEENGASLENNQDHLGVESLDDRTLEATTNTDGLTEDVQHHVEDVDDVAAEDEAEAEAAEEPTLPDDDEWGDEEYDELADGTGGEGTQGEDTAQYDEQELVEPALEMAENQAQLSPAPLSSDREVPLSETSKNEKHATNLHQPPPIRKRSFSEVEEEPDDGERHSSGPKKPRHA